METPGPQRWPHLSIFPQPFLTRWPGCGLPAPFLLVEAGGPRELLETCDVGNLQPWQSASSSRPSLPDMLPELPGCASGLPHLSPPRGFHWAPSLPLATPQQSAERLLCGRGWGSQPAHGLALEDAPWCTVMTQKGDLNALLHEWPKCWL